MTIRDVRNSWVSLDDLLSFKTELEIDDEALVTKFISEVNDLNPSKTTFTRFITEFSNASVYRVLMRTYSRQDLDADWTVIFEEHLNSLHVILGSKV